MAGLNRSDRLSPFPCLPWCPLRVLLSSPLASPTAPAGHTAPGSQRQQLGWVGRRPSRCCSLWLWTHTVRSGPGSTAVQPLSRVGPGERWGRGRGGVNLRGTLVKNSIKGKGPLPGPVGAQRVLGVLAGVHEHHHLGARSRRGQQRSQQRGPAGGAGAL